MQYSHSAMHRVALKADGTILESTSSNIQQCKNHMPIALYHDSVQLAAMYYACANYTIMSSSC
eukprot:17270-Heterococcus_DN1.PRE.2